MGIQVISGATADLLTIDPTSKAGRVTSYDSLGNELEASPTSAYLADINVRQSAASVAGIAVWSMRNVAGPRTAYIRHVRLMVSFDGTATLATTLRYDLKRFSAATPTAGTAITAIKKRNAYVSPNVSDIRFMDTGLTTTGVIFESALHTVGVPASVTGTVVETDLDFIMPLERYNSTFELASGEGLAVQLNTAAIIGLSIRGTVIWDEK